MPQQFRISLNRLYSFQSLSSTISELISHTPPQLLSQLSQIKIMHSPTLCSVATLTPCPNLLSLYLSSNQLTHLTDLISLPLLHTLDVRSNRIVSLKGVEKLTSLRRIDASHNAITDGLANSQLEYVYLWGNRIQRIQWLRQLNKLKEIGFQRGKATNPVCKLTDSYYKDIVIYGSNTIEKIDQIEGSTLKDVKHKYKELENKQHNISHNSMNHTEYMNNVNTNNMNNTNMTNHMNNNNTYANSKQFIKSNANIHTNRIIQQLQQIIHHKDQLLYQNKSKFSSLQLQCSSLKKQLLKKQLQSQRMHGQVSQLQRTIQAQKHTSSSLQSQCSHSLQQSASLLKTIEQKTNEVQKYKQLMQQMRVECAEHKAVRKDQEKRLDELRIKAMSSVEEQSTRNQEMRRRWQLAEEEVKNRQHERQELKERIRELTMLLREWEYKYEKKINQINMQKEKEKQHIVREYQNKIKEIQENYQGKIQEIYLEMGGKVQKIEKQYKSSIQQLKENQRKLKKQIQYYNKNDKQTKIALQTVLQKNNNQQNLIKQFQQLLIKLKKQLHQSAAQREHLRKQCSVLKIKLQQAIQLNDQRMRQQQRKFQQKYRQKQKQCQILSSERDRIQNEFQQKIQKLMQTIQTKNTLLDDKNDTIQKLKSEYDTLQRDNQKKVDTDQYDTLLKKYNKSKDKLHQLTAEVEKLAEENQQLLTYRESTQALEKEFTDIKDILAQQTNAIAEKDKHIEELVTLLSQCKRTDTLQRQELEQQRREIHKMQGQISEKERKSRRQREEIKEEYHRKSMELQMKKQNINRLAAQVKQLTNALKQ